MNNWLLKNIITETIYNVVSYTAKDISHSKPQINQDIISSEQLCGLSFIWHAICEKIVLISALT